MTGRNIDYLRLSVTDQCDLNCLYCTPCERAKDSFSKETLGEKELFRLVHAAVTLGVRHVRLTGGEPLVRPGLTKFIRQLKGLEGLEEISLTTNGMRLKSLAPELKDVGLDRINISLDTLRAEKFSLLTGAGPKGFRWVWEGIEAAISQGLSPVKINVVVMRGINDDEVVDFVRLTEQYPLNVRFIEFFPTNVRAKELEDRTMDNRTIRETIESVFGPLVPAPEIRGNGPAENFKLSGAPTSTHIGFISGVTRNFCQTCNRIRIDSAGRMKPCLFSENFYDLKEFLSVNPDTHLIAGLKKALAVKSRYNKETLSCRRVEMSCIGG